MRKISLALWAIFGLCVAFFIYTRIAYFIEARTVLPQARGFVGKFYARYNARDFGYIYDKLSAAKFKKNISRPDFDKLMGIVYANLGKAKSAKLTGWNIRHSKGALYCDMRYRITHDNAEAKENFTLIRYQGAWLLSGYHINSKNLILKK
ncbi:MAG: hypothetical protein PHH68_06060 [Candidatus Omnitrophica bacterium]|jgi:hypothetical protein|nr:DUF4019 domain-containing protein [Candidatus Omnitrophota bacterium]MDD5079872.1 hypothetical protein [Candidatus Omnitrophota bacterium]